MILGVRAIKAEAITELAAAESGLPVVKVTAASLKTEDVMCPQLNSGVSPNCT